MFITITIAADFRAASEPETIFRSVGDESRSCRFLRLWLHLLGKQTRKALFMYLVYFWRQFYQFLTINFIRSQIDKFKCMEQEPPGVGADPFWPEPESAPGPQTSGAAQKKWCLCNTVSMLTWYSWGSCARCPPGWCPSGGQTGPAHQDSWAAWSGTPGENKKRFLKKLKTK